MERTCRIILIGMMGSGKTTVGRLLAKRSGWPHLDNDELLDRLVGRTPKQLLAEEGEARLRDSESAALAHALRAPAPAIVSAAAGTILDPGNRIALREEGHAVWLRAGAATVAQRATGGAHRAWLDTGGAAWIRNAVSIRDPLYASVSELTIDVDRLASRVVARQILAWARQLDACRPFLRDADQA